MLREMRSPVTILCMSDGTLSHPNSKKFPRERLRELRENELKEAASILGVVAEDIVFFRMPDRGVPGNGASGFEEATANLSDLIKRRNIETIIAPWRRDPHPDHRAASEIVRAACGDRTVIEFAIWLYHLAEKDDAPRVGEAEAVRLDVSSVLKKKLSAIRAHRSQVSDLIDDDPEGFRLGEEVIATFEQPFEIYLMPCQQITNR